MLRKQSNCVGMGGQAEIRCMTCVRSRKQDLIFDVYLQYIFWEEEAAAATIISHKWWHRMGHSTLPN